MSGPSPRVLDLFAVPDDVRPMPGSPDSAQVVAGDLVLSPHHDAAVTAWFSPQLARLAVQRDERPDRGVRDLRIAMPVPARDGSWVVEGWAANRWEPGTTGCDEVGVARAAGRLLHALLAESWPQQPEVLARREDPRTLAERDLLAGLVDLQGAAGARAPQVVHTGLWGQVVLDAYGAPVVTHVRPTWAPPLWADALCAVDAATDGAGTEALEDVGRGTSPDGWRRLVVAALRLRAQVERRGEAYDDVLSRWDGIRV